MRNPAGQSKVIITNDHKIEFNSFYLPRLTVPGSIAFSQSFRDNCFCLPSVL
jgi:hypothetical protein